ncbi:MAG: succinate dehydrogenase cytochrome b subunit [Deltaproteobacteria bacterium]|nr:succinate dehydrogenase cytochrome b subunit [Deltaproteobacteria bacterium]
MNWLFRTVISSIGKKQIMAVTGLGFCLFLATHLAGNLTLYGGKELFLSYVDHLHALGYLITAAEIGLVVFALAHVITGLFLFFENVMARPVRYAVKRSAGGRTIGSATAPYTGILILVFILIHLLTFRFVDKTTTNDFLILTQKFAHSGWAIFYIVGVIIVAVHVSHGLWSGFQTLGLNHPKYMPLIRKGGILFSVVVGAGFASIPLFVFSMI